MEAFKQFRNDLDSKHDQYERQVKTSRDITIESKRIIFLLHTTATDVENEKDRVFSETHTRLSALSKNKLKNIALELVDCDPHQFHRAHSPGIQEFIEAILFFYFLKNKTVRTYDEIHREYFLIENKNSENQSQLILHLSMLDYILGLADFTGELMRKTINGISSGNVQECYKNCNIVRSIYIGCMGIYNNGFRTFGRKITTLAQTLSKLETVCYTLHVRGNEVPQNILASVIDASAKEERMVDDFDE